MIKKRILVIGSNGKLGQGVVENLYINDNIELLLASVEAKSFFDEVQYSQVDITDKKQVKNLILNFYPDFIINTSGYTNVDKCETDKEIAWNINVKGVEYLAKYAVPSNAHLIQISTDYVFDGSSGPYSEDDLPNPISYYGRSKLASENVIKRFDIKSTIFRANVLFGATKFGKSDFVKWVYDSLQNKKRIRIVTDQINNPTYIDDLARTIIAVCETSKTGLYNLGGIELLNRFEFTRKIADYFNLDFSLVEPILTKDLKQQAPRPLNSGLINLKAETELGYKPRALNDCFRIIKRTWENKPF